MSTTIGTDAATGLPFNLDNPLLANPGSTGTALPNEFPLSNQGVLSGSVPGTAGGGTGLPLGQGGPPEPDAGGGFTDPLSTVPQNLPPSTILPSAPSVASGINWLEELAIRAMLLIVGMVLIAGGLKIAAGRSMPSLPDVTKLWPAGLLAARATAAKRANVPAPRRDQSPAEHDKIIKSAHRNALTTKDKNLIRHAFPHVDFAPEAAL